METKEKDLAVRDAAGVEKVGGDELLVGYQAFQSSALQDFDQKLPRGWRLLFWGSSVLDLLFPCLLFTQSFLVGFAAGAVYFPVRLSLAILHRNFCWISNSETPLGSSQVFSHLFVGLGALGSFFLLVVNVGMLSLMLVEPFLGTWGLLVFLLLLFAVLTEGLALPGELRNSLGPGRFSGLLKFNKEVASFRASQRFLPRRWGISAYTLGFALFFPTYLGWLLLPFPDAIRAVVDPAMALLLGFVVLPKFWTKIRNDLDLYLCRKSQFVLEELSD